MSIRYLRFLAALPNPMARFNHLPQYEHGLPEALGVLVVNLGTPDAPTADAVRRYLAEFLFDPRVVEIPRPIWWLILHGYILRTRPARSAEAYEKIWTEQGSHCFCTRRTLPARFRTSCQLDCPALFTLKSQCPMAARQYPTHYRNMFDQCVRRIIVLPLYPQYSGTTTGSVFEAVTQSLSRAKVGPGTALRQSLS